MTRNKNAVRKHSDFFIQNKLETENSNMVYQVENRLYSPISSNLLYGKSTNLVRTISTPNTLLAKPKSTPKSNNIQLISNAISTCNNDNNDEARTVSIKRDSLDGLQNIDIQRNFEVSEDCSEIIENKMMDYQKNKEQFKIDFFANSNRMSENYFTKQPNHNRKFL